MASAIPAEEEEPRDAARASNNRWIENMVYTRKKLRNVFPPAQSPDRVSLNLPSMPKQEVWEFRTKLADELKQVRELLRKVEERELEVSGCVDVDVGVVEDHSDEENEDQDEDEVGLDEIDGAVNHQSVGNGIDGGGKPFSEVDLDDSYAIGNGKDGVSREVSRGGETTTPVVKHGSSDPKISFTAYDYGGMIGNVDREKRTPKANQYYPSSEFVVGKEKFTPPTKKPKVGGRGSGFGLVKHTGQVFKNCSALLTKLMKHKHGWVFNTPVDVEKLQLHDYFLIIKHPMDLGTVKKRLGENWYGLPREFGEDVRLTFRNAMTYNPEGNEVHGMAKELSGIFEQRWEVMERQYNLDSWSEAYNIAGPPTVKGVPRVPLEGDRNPDGVHFTPQVVRARPMKHGRSGRSRSLKKPKARDPNKRDMTFDEKQKLSKNLETLPSEKLDSVVEIIKKRNAALLLQEDSIEVDIDSVDAETLWDLDRLVTNYKKSLSKHKRRKELAMQGREMTHQNVQGKNQVTPSIIAVSKETKIDENGMGAPTPLQEDKQEDSSSRSSSSSNGSSRSGSSSSDSDCDSSSESDTRHSPRD